MPRRTIRPSNQPVVVGHGEGNGATEEEEEEEEGEWQWTHFKCTLHFSLQWNDLSTLT